MKRISKDIFLVNVFFVIGFFLIYQLFAFYISSQLRSEQKQSVGNLKQFVMNETRAFEKEENEDDIKDFINDVYSDQKGNSEFSINFNYDGGIISQDSKMVKSFNLPKNKIVRLDNFYVLNFDVFIVKLNKYISVQIVNDISKELLFIKKIKGIFLLFLTILLTISIGITKIFYNKLRKQINILKNATGNININNFEFSLNDNYFYVEFKDVIDAYKTMMNKIKTQTENEIEFVNNASHELKTPIFIIGGYAELLEKDGQSNPEIFKEAVTVIKSETKEMAALSEKLLFLARKEYHDINLEIIDIKEMIELISEEMKIVHPDSNIKIIGCTFNIESDQKLLKQLLRNIIGNSIKYGNNAPVEIVLSQNTLTMENKVVINDFGIGMDEEELKNVFNRFYRADKSRNKLYKGHGLGLSIVKTISEILNIKVEITSKKNIGTSVWVVFVKNK